MNANLKILMKLQIIYEIYFHYKITLPINFKPFMRFDVKPSEFYTYGWIVGGSDTKRVY